MRLRRTLGLLLVLALVPVDLVRPFPLLAAVTIPGAVRVQQDTPGISWSGSWNQAGTSVASGGTRAVTRSTPATLTVAFSGTAISVIAERGPSWGQAKVYVDGSLKKTIDLYDKATKRSAPVYKIVGLAAGSHTLTLAATGKKSAKSTSAQVNVDAFDIVGTLKPAVTVSRLEQSDGRLFWDGPWRTASGTLLSAGSMKTATGGAAETVLEFKGRGVTLVGSRGPGYGRAEVFLDGKSQGVLSAYAPTPVAQKVLWSRGGLTNSSHTVTVRLLGTHESVAKGSSIGLDAFEVRGTASQSWRRAEDNDARITEAGPWSRASNSLMSGGSYSYATAAGAISRVRFTGSAFRLVAPRNTSYGQIEVVCDGVSRIVDLYAAKLQARRRVLTVWELDPAKSHELEIRVLGTKSGHAKWHSATFDAIDIRGTFEQAPDVRAFAAVEDDDSHLALTGGWRTASGSAASHGRVTVAASDGQSAKISFRGTAARWIAPRTPGSGKARVLIDGTQVATVDLYAATTSQRQVVWSRTGMSDAAHTVTIEVLGTHNPASSGSDVTVDCLQATGVLLDPPRPSGWHRLQQGDAMVVRTGVWSTVQAAGSDAGSHAASRDARAAATVKFTGTQVAWIGARDKTYGRAYVYLDGKLAAVLDNYNYAPELGRVLWRSTGLTNATHTLRIRIDDRKATGSSYWVPVDAVDIVGEPAQALVRADQSDYHVGWGGTWSNASRPHAYAGSIRKATKAASATFTFVGPRFDLLAETGPSWGKANISIDGAAASTIDLYRTSSTSSMRVFSRSGLANGTHTVVVSWTGQKNTGASTSAINIDAVDTGGQLSGATAAARARDTIIRTAIEQLGKPYVWAAAGPNTFDCSGFVLYSYNAAGISLPHYSGAQYDLCDPKPLSQLIPGDLAFSSSPTYIHHVGLYIGNGLTINAPSSGRNVEYRNADTYGCFGRIKKSMWPTK